MKTGTIARRPTVDSLWPVESPRGRGLRLVVLALIGSLLLAISAKTQVPFYPVPMTLQTMVVFLLGIALGPRLGAACVLAYLLEGALGLPVFAGTPEKGIGLAYLAGPTGGYLIGFLPAVVICGLAIERGWRGFRLAGAVLAATIVIFVLGAGWLATIVGPVKALTLGVLPFLPGALVKLALTVALVEVGLTRFGNTDDRPD